MPSGFLFSGRWQGLIYTKTCVHNTARGDLELLMLLLHLTNVTISAFCGVGDQIRGFLFRQALYQLSCTPSQVFLFIINTLLKDKPRALTKYRITLPGFISYVLNCFSFVFLTTQIKGK